MDYEERKNKYYPLSQKIWTLAFDRNCQLISAYWRDHFLRLIKLMGYS